MSTFLRFRLQIVAVLVGIAVPSTICGKAAIAIPVALALLLCIPELVQRQTWSSLGRRTRTPVGWAVIATAILWLPGVVFSILPELSFEAWARTWVFVLLAALLWEILGRTDDGRDVALRACVAGIAATLAFAAIGFVVPPFLSLLHARGWTENPPALVLKQFASVGMMMMPIALWAAFRLGKKWRALAVLENVGLLWLLVATESRASMAGVLAMLAITGIVMVLRWRSRRVVFGATAALVIASAGVLGWMNTIPHSLWAPRLQHTLNPSIPVWLIDVPRREIWAFTWKKFVESPWIGHGINAVNYLPGANQMVPDVGWQFTYIPGHPHDWALEILAETGVIGFVPLVLAAVFLFARLFVRYHRTHDPAFLAANCVHVGYWVSGLFNFSFWSAWWQLSYVLLLALAYPGLTAGPPGCVVQRSGEEDATSEIDKQMEGSRQP